MEYLPEIDETGAVIGRATRSECHSGSMKLHPVVHLHIVTTDGQILLQRRSESKDIQPGKWDTAVGGHVDFGEEIREALIRESREELNIDASNAKQLANYIFQSPVERELINAYTLEVDSNFKCVFDPVEISEVRFWHIDEIKAAIGKGILTPNFEQEFERILLPNLK